jgi:hypothetical protein
MAKADYEAWLVEKGRRNGAPYAHRHELHVPLNLARGRLEDLSDLQLREALRDPNHEAQRRNDAS